MTTENEGFFVVKKKTDRKTGRKKQSAGEKPEEKDGQITEYARERAISLCIRIMAALGLFAAVVAFDKKNIDVAGHNVREISGYMQSRESLELVKKEIGKKIQQMEAIAEHTETKK